jgi:deoxyribose-phosphate aldolase
MYKELCLYQYAPLQTPEQYQKEVFSAIEKNLNGVCLPVYVLRELKQYIPNGMTISAPIDFPFGVCDTSIKLNMIHQAIKAGANSIDIVLNDYKVYNNHNSFIKDVEAQVKLCREYNICPRVMLNCPVFDQKDCIFLGKLIRGIGIEFACPSVGNHLDDMADNLIMCKVLQKEIDINMIFNGAIKTEKELDIVEKSGVWGLRLYSTRLFGVL